MKNPNLIKYLPSYRLEPKYKFDCDIVKQIIQNFLNVTLSEYKYTAKNAESLAQQISEKIRNQIKDQFYDRYRIICLVTIGEKLSQDFCAKSSHLWDDKMDRFVYQVYDTPNFFCIATVYALYYD